MKILFLVLLGALTSSLGEAFSLEEEEFVNVEARRSLKRRRRRKPAPSNSEPGWCPTTLVCDASLSCSCTIPTVSVGRNKFVNYGPIFVQPGSTFQLTLGIQTGSATIYLNYGNEKANHRRFDEQSSSGSLLVTVPGDRSMAYIAIRGGRSRSNVFSVSASYTGLDEKCPLSDLTCDEAPGSTPDKCNAKKPNIILIYTDDQGYGDTTATNSDSKFDTPNIDRIGNEGIMFNDAHSAASICTPSRYGILTGHYPFRVRPDGNVVGAEEPTVVAETRQTLATLLGAAGYHTHMVGKWHLGMEVVGSPGRRRDWSKPLVGGPVDRGFNSFYGIAASMNYGILTYIEDNMVTEEPSLWTTRVFEKQVKCPRGGPKICPDDYSFRRPFGTRKPKGKGYRAPQEVAPSFDEKLTMGIFTDKAIEYIEDRAQNHPSQPFFLYLALTAPHYPMSPADDFIGTSDAGEYGDFMVETDARVGQILQKVDDLGIDDDTLIIFTSDNGPEAIYTVLARDYDHHSNGGFRGGKRDNYEGGHRVPMFMRWPGVINAGRNVDDPVSQTDLFATFASMVGVSVPESQGEDSFSLWRSMCDASFSKTARAGHPIMHQDFQGKLAIRDHNYKLFLNKKLLYDLEKDPSETTNIYNSRPDLVENLLAKATRIRDIGHM